MILEQKREAIAVLCMTETNNLNLIEEMQTQLSKSLSHLPRLSSEENIYYRKYTQLEKYMHEYINSTNEAQE